MNIAAPPPALPHSAAPAEPAKPDRRFKLCDVKAPGDWPARPERSLRAQGRLQQ
jgi:hypothetical protein